MINADESFYEVVIVKKIYTSKVGNWEAEVNEKGIKLTKEEKLLRP